MKTGDLIKLSPKSASSPYIIREKDGLRFFVGDLVKLRPKNKQDRLNPDKIFMGILLDIHETGTVPSRSVLFDILVGEIDQILTVSDTFFEVWKVE